MGEEKDRTNNVSPPEKLPPKNKIDEEIYKDKALKEYIEGKKAFTIGIKVPLRMKVKYDNLSIRERRFIQDALRGVLNNLLFGEKKIEEIHREAYLKVEQLIRVDIDALAKEFWQKLYTLDLEKIREIREKRLQEEKELERVKPYKEIVKEYEDLKRDLRMIMNMIKDPTYTIEKKFSYIEGKLEQMVLKYKI